MLGNIEPVNPVRKRAVTRERPVAQKRPAVSDSQPDGTPIPEEFRCVKLKAKLDRLATEAWQIKELLDSNLLCPATLSDNSPDRVIKAILNHVRRVAPGFCVPLRTPRVETGALIEAGGQFTVSDGWVWVKLARHFLSDRRAVGAILAHELCHYILKIQEFATRMSMKMNGSWMRVCLYVDSGRFFLSGYKNDVAMEYRTGHQLGYLTDSEYDFAARYVLERRSNNSLRLLTAADQLKRKLVARIPENSVRERLILNARAR